MIRLIIAEDEMDCIERLKTNIDRYGEENKILFDITVYHNGMDLVENYRPGYDILLLDIEMPLLDGMSAAQYIRKVDSRVLIMFITHSPNYAIKGYEVSAIDYMLKPVEYYAFALKMKKLMRLLTEQDCRKLLVQGPGLMKQLPVKDIYYLEVADHQLVYHTKDGEVTTRGALHAVEKSLEDEPFARCNSCYLINLAHLEEIKGDVAVVCGHELQISRRQKKSFLQAVIKYHRGWGK